MSMFADDFRSIEFVNYGGEDIRHAVATKVRQYRSMGARTHTQRLLKACQKRYAINRTTIPSGEYDNGNTPIPLPEV